MKRTVKDLVNLKGKVVLVRADFNVPIDDKGKMLDMTKVNEALPTLRYLIRQGAKVVVMSHLDRPNGFELSKSLWPISLYLLKKLNTKVYFSNKVIGQEVKNKISMMENGSVLLLENVRFYKEETDCDLNFARQIASLGDVFVNDAFGTLHRKHASCYGVAIALPNAIGMLVEKELNVLTKVVENPEHPFVAIIGGAKVTDKVKMLRSLVEKADVLLLGGAMAYTFLVASGIAVGDSKKDDECVPVAREILDYAASLGKEVLLPIDHVAVKKDDLDGKAFVVENLQDGEVGFDIGPKTVEKFGEAIKSAGQIFWNGPLGKYEDKRFERGTFEIAKRVAQSKGYSVIGGGDVVGAVKLSGYADKMNYLSTGGGASLKFIENGSLPCIDVIQEKI